MRPSTLAERLLDTKARATRHIPWEPELPERYERQHGAISEEAA
jgi:hypothetical protein